VLRSYDTLFIAKHDGKLVFNEEVSGGKWFFPDEIKKRIQTILVPDLSTPLRGIYKMSKIAIDVVLLPPKEIMDLCIKLNKTITGFRKIELDKEKCLPHISLCMGTLDEKDIPKVRKIIGAISRPGAILNLEIYEIRNKEDNSNFAIKKTEELQQLHEKIMKKLEFFTSNEATLEMLFTPPTPEERTLFWINNYREKFSFRNFYPHITLGLGPMTPNIPFPIRFKASRLALCYLGNYCTCRKIFFETELKIIIKYL